MEKPRKQINFTLPTTEVACQTHECAPDFEDEDEDIRRENIYNLGGELSKIEFSYSEVWWFVMTVLTSVLAVVASFWAWMPDKILNMVGIEYIPNRYWVLAWSNQFFAAWWTATLTLHCGSLMKCHERDSYLTMEDKYTRQLRPPNKAQVSGTLKQKTTIKKRN